MWCHIKAMETFLLHSKAENTKPTNKPVITKTKLFVISYKHSVLTKYCEIGKHRDLTKGIIECNWQTYGQSLSLR